MPVKEQTCTFRVITAPGPTPGSRAVFWCAALRAATTTIRAYGSVLVHWYKQGQTRPVYRPTAMGAALGRGISEVVAWLGWVRLRFLVVIGLRVRGTGEGNFRWR